MQKRIFYIIFIFLLLIIPCQSMAALEWLNGRILLQVESRGEAWYVSPLTGRRHYLGRPEDAFRVMREQGLGISNRDLDKIPLGGAAESADLSFAHKHRGKIFLAVESKGEAWYVNPGDLRRYYLGRPADAFALLQKFGLGIKNADLNKIPTSSEKLSLQSLEARIHELINQERAKYKLGALRDSAAIAAVAREHSEDLALENKAFTSLSKACDLPLIHHEGLDFGINHSERLMNRGVYDYSRSGENIALVAVLDYSIEYIPHSALEQEIKNCESERLQAEAEFKSKTDSTHDSAQKIAIIKQEIAERTRFFKAASAVKPINIANHGEEEIARKMVQSWMESPGHKKNILTAEYDASGIGAALIDGYVIATQVFVKKADCGYKNGPCCESGGCYLPYTCNSANICIEE